MPTTATAPQFPEFTTFEITDALRNARYIAKGLILAAHETISGDIDADEVQVLLIELSDGTYSVDVVRDVGHYSRRYVGDDGESFPSYDEAVAGFARWVESVRTFKCG